MQRNICYQQSGIKWKQSGIKGKHFGDLGGKYGYLSANAIRKTRKKYTVYEKLLSISHLNDYGASVAVVQNGEL